MKRFTVLSVIAVLALSACAQGVTHCDGRTAGSCVASKSVDADTKADNAFNKSLHK